ncbi:hypothetical protein B5M09_008668 [Aphanomyces astaci]|uniref:Transmembrane protein n=1 Tax=Aphanomyces astaci TaxID=112090 RepID=A0A3R7WD69_APHAT|nr:hypothetical protein B5M09_008668 [Aphanomyces astaci]
MATRRHVDSILQPASGWVDGEAEIYDRHPSILQDERMTRWDASTTFPRQVRFITCAVLFAIGTASFMYRNMFLHETREHTILTQIRRSIVEMDAIAATATAMERHVQRLASLTQTHLDQATKVADTSLNDGNAVRPDVLWSEVDAIHADTMKHMESMLHEVVQTTLQDVLDLSAAWTANHPPTPPPSSSDVVVVEPVAIVDTPDPNNPITAAPPQTENNVTTTTNIDVAKKPTSPPIVVDHSPATSQPNTSPTRRPAGNPTHFVAFTMVGTVAIAGVFVYWMQTRGSFLQNRLAFQQGTRRLQSLVTSAHQWGLGVLGRCRASSASTWRGMLDSFMNLRDWWRRGRREVEVEDVSDDDDDISFYPQTPIPSNNPYANKPLYEDNGLPRKHISFADVESDDEEYEDDEADAPPPTRRPSHLVRTNLYENLLTPEPATARVYHVRLNEMTSDCNKAQLDQS